MDKLANEQTFLQLFVSQLKNQDPLNPADGTQFVSQLAQFSQLEQTINMGQDIGAIRQQIAPPTTDNTTGTPSSN
jgi:flagellar basal-body rod modification protein FlgD